MGTDLFAVKWTFVYGHLSEAELGFLENFPRSDDGSIHFDEDTIKTALAEEDITQEDLNRVPELLKAINQAIEKSGGEGVSLTTG